MSNTKCSNANSTIEQYQEDFKNMLVTRMNWSVSKAYEYKSIKLNNAYKKGLTILEAYIKIFKVKKKLWSVT